MMTYRKKTMSIMIMTVIVIVSVMLAAGCSKNDKTVYTKEEQEDSNIIKWITTDLSKLPQTNIDETNRILKEKGLDYQIRMVYLGNEDYLNNVKSYLKENDGDIIWCGFLDNGVSEAAQMADSGILCKLDDMLMTDTGRIIYDYYPDSAWKSVRYNEGYYYIQNTRVGSSEQYYIEFNPEYVSAELFASFDGTIQGLSDIQKKTGKMIAMDNICMEQINGLSGCCNYYGCLISDSDGKADLKYYDNVYDYMKIMNEMYYDGVLAYNDPEDGLPVDINNCAAYLKFDYPGNNSWPYVYGYGGDSVFNLSSASVGICEDSLKKENALKVLSLVLTDREAADAFLYGIKDKDYKFENDGISFLNNGSQMMYIRELTNAGYSAADKTTDDRFNGSRYDELKLFWESLNDKPYLGFYFDSTGCKDEFDKIVEIYNDGFPDVRNPELKKSMDAYVKRLKEAGAEAVYEQLNAQLADFAGNK